MKLRYSDTANARAFKMSLIATYVGVKAISTPFNAPFNQGFRGPCNNSRMGVPEPQPVYPVNAMPQQLDSAPPPYTVGVGAAPIAVEMQPVYMQPAYAQPTIVQPQYAPPPPPQPQQTVIVSHGCKHVDYDGPYLEYCPRCQTSVTTRTVHTIGTCWWIILFVGVFVFCWPILFCLCCAGSKDVKHYCPNCGTLIAAKKRGC